MIGYPYLPEFDHPEYIPEDQRNLQENFTIPANRDIFRRKSFWIPDGQILANSDNRHDLNYSDSKLQYGLFSFKHKLLTKY